MGFFVANMGSRIDSQAQGFSPAPTSRTSDVDTAWSQPPAAGGIGTEEAQREFEQCYRRGASGDAPEAVRQVDTGASGSSKENEGTQRASDRPAQWERREAFGHAQEAEQGGTKDKSETSLSTLIGNLFSERLGTAVTTATPAPANPTPSSPVETTVAHLVERILVSHPDHVGEQEVRLSVRDSVLPDTEIRLSRGADGLLSVTLATGRSDAFQTLVAAQAELKLALDAREQQEIRLLVINTRKTGTDDTDSERRSRGHMAYAPDDNPDNPDNPDNAW
jgi:type III secretion system needle length determinant